MPISQANTTLKSTNTKCVSWLACESGTAVTHAATDAPPSRASPLPQGICAYLELLQHSNPLRYEIQ